MTFFEECRVYFRVETGPKAVRFSGLRRGKSAGLRLAQLSILRPYVSRSRREWGTLIHRCVRLETARTGGRSKSGTPRQQMDWARQPDVPGLSLTPALTGSALAGQVR